MADQLQPSRARLTPAAMTLLSRQNAWTARVAREAGCPKLAERCAKAAVYYRNRRAVATQPERERKRAGRRVA